MNKKLKLFPVLKKIYLLTIFISLLSCDNSYEVSKEKLDCRYSRNRGFELSELNVTQFDDTGRPVDYEEIITGFYISKHKTIGDEESYRTFYFNKPNGEKGFEWTWHTSENMSKYYKTLPFKLMNNTWYLLNLSDGSCDIDKLFFQFLDNENVKQFHKVGNCGAAW